MFQKAQIWKGHVIPLSGIRRAFVKMLSQAGAPRKELELLLHEWRNKKHERKLYPFPGRDCMFYVLLADMQKFHFWCTFCSSWLYWVFSKLCSTQDRFFSNGVDSSMFTLEWFSLKSISEPLLQSVFQIVRYVVNKKKCTISNDSLFEKKYMCMHVCTLTNEHTFNIQRICNTYPELVRPSVTFLAYTWIKRKYPEL